MTCFAELTDLIRQTHGEPDVEDNGPGRQSATWLLDGHGKYGFTFTSDRLRQGFQVFSPDCHVKISTNRGPVSLPLAVAQLTYTWKIRLPELQVTP